MTGPNVAESKAIQQQTGRTFHAATRVLPERVRHPTYALYGFFRVADDVVDDPDPDRPAVQRERLRDLRTAALGEADTDDPVLSAFNQVRERHGISDEEVDTFLAAMEMDVDRARYDTFADLETYLRGSSVAVAYMMLSVMDPEDAARARSQARALGEAFQLTNFLRDVREDVLEYDRIYLPRETLQRHGASIEDVENLRFTDEVEAAIRSELHRTEQRYRTGVAGIRHLPEDCQFAVLLSAVLYAEHHRLIRRQGLDVLSHRPSLSTARRLWLVARTWAAWKRSGDPEAVFERVSAVPATPPGDETPAAGGDGTANGDRDTPTPSNPARSLADRGRATLARGLGAIGSLIPLSLAKIRR